MSVPVFPDLYHTAVTECLRLPFTRYGERWTTMTPSCT